MVSEIYLKGNDRMTFNQSLHEKALLASENYRRSESELFACLLDVDRYKVYFGVGATSLFDYGTRFLKLSEAVTYNFVSVVKKSREIPELKGEILSGALPIGKAKKLVPIVNSQNQATLIEFAKTSTYRELERKVSELNPKPAVANLKSTGPSEETLNLTMSAASAEKFRKIQDLLSSKTRQSLGLQKCLEQILDLVLEKLNPPPRSRYGNRRTHDAGAPKTGRVTKISANVRREVRHQHQDRCTFVHTDGERCNNRRWLHLHHIHSKVFNGTDQAENLTLLCAAHHRLVHHPEPPTHLS
jgi:hypothetical protein